MGITFLNLDEFCKGLTPVTSTQLFTRVDEFHPEGLFSEKIFGHVGSLDRKKTYSYLNLNCFVVHPTAYKILIQLDRKIEKFLSTEESFKVDKEGNLTIDDSGVTGINEFIKIFPKIVFRGDTENREKFINLLEKAYKNKVLFVDKVPVFPPDQRPVYPDESGRPVQDPVNPIYTKIIRQAINIKSMGKQGTLFDLMNWGVQKVVIDHDEFIRTKIGKKHGLIRSSLLGKRVDFSGRAVITSGPQLKANEIGIPFILAISLFEPFIIHVLLYSGKFDKKLVEDEVGKFTKLDLSTNSISIVFRSIKGGDVIPKSLYDLFFTATKLAMENRVVVGKRDPVLQRESLRAFIPVLTTETVVQLSTLFTGGFNADFDGDQMAIFHPITTEAQDEAKKRMMSSGSSNQTAKTTLEISKEMCVGLYILSKDKKSTKPPIHVSEEDLQNATDPYIPVVYKGHNTTMGRAIINSCFPKDFKFIDESVGKKLGNKLIYEICSKYGDSIGFETANRLKNYGFKFATLIGPSLNLDEISIPKEIYEIKKNLEKASTEEAVVLMDKMKGIMIEHLKDSGVYDLVQSGSTKGWDQPISILVAKGIMSDPTGKILAPIKSSLSDGLTATEYFAASGGARKGIIDRVINTADTGYTSRKLAFLLNPVEIDPYLKDCGTHLKLDLKLDADIIKRLTGRYIVKNGKLLKFEGENFKNGDVIHLRSPIFCKSLKLCHTCYGDLLKIHKSQYAGIVAAQAIGERGTQLIMRSFHSTAIKIKKRDLLQDISNNDPLINLEQLKESFYQKENSLFCIKNCILTLDFDSYTIGDDLLINEEENLIDISSLISKADFGNIVFDLILDYPVTLKYTKITKTKTNIQIELNPDDEILEVPIQKEDIREMILYIGRLLGGKERFKDINHLFLKLFNMYNKEISDMDLVQFEVLISQVLRDKDNPMIPARVGSDPEHPIMMNIKKNIFASGFLQGLSFENIGEAIKSGLIATTELQPSVLEKLLTGTLVEKKKKD